MKETSLPAKNLRARSYGFKELAVLYFPNIAPSSASVRLKQWIIENPKVMERLTETNYRRSARILTPQQVEIIADVFGSPY